VIKHAPKCPNKFKTKSLKRLYNLVAGSATLATAKIIPTTVSISLLLLLAHKKISVFVMFYVLTHTDN